jgi:hypothetical protein
VEGSGESAAVGDAVTVDWDGYTIGYYGRPFEARNKARGGAFVGADKDFLRFRLGDGSVVAGFEEAVRGMRVGGARRVIVPVELGYPDGDFNRVGPKPSTFSVREGGGGERGRAQQRGGERPPPSLPSLTLSSFTSAPIHPRCTHATTQGKRALSFVLKNQGMIDKTLMFDVELLRLSKGGGEGGGA